VYNKRLVNNNVQESSYGEHVDVDVDVDFPTTSTDSQLTKSLIKPTPGVVVDTIVPVTSAISPLSVLSREDIADLQSCLLSEFWNNSSYLSVITIASNGSSENEDDTDNYICTEDDDEDIDVREVMNEPIVNSDSTSSEYVHGDSNDSEVIVDITTSNFDHWNDTGKEGAVIQDILSNLTFTCPKCKRVFTSWDSCNTHVTNRNHGSHCIHSYSHNSQGNGLFDDHLFRCVSDHSLLPLDAHSGYCDLKGRRKYLEVSTISLAKLLIIIISLLICDVILVYVYSILLFWFKGYACSCVCRKS
jgi:hypothetical protein